MLERWGVMPEVREDVINVKLAEVLSRDFGIDARAERVAGKRWPDIKCYYRGFIIVIEASYDKDDAERDAERRIEQGLADVVLALWIRQRFRDMPESELMEAIRRARYSIKVFVPRDLRETLLPYLEGIILKRAEPATEWFEDVDLPMIKTIIEHSIAFLIREEQVQRLIEEMRSRFSEFINALKSFDRAHAIRRGLYEVLYKLYGLSVAEARDPDVAFGHTALSLLLSTVFYEHVRGIHPELRPVEEYIARVGPIEGLKRALEDLLKIDYKTAVRLAIEILRTLPQDLAHRVRDIVDLGIRMASNSSLLRRDFAGRVYHEITGDIALRKGFATYYTEVPAAYLLATLAASSLLDLDGVRPLNLSQGRAREIIGRIRSLRVGDLACGSGTLLTASYAALMRGATMLKFYYNLDDVDLDDLGRTLIEEGIYGIDALRYASQITAINLALMGPGTIRRENVYTIYLGYIAGWGQAWLGSLELLRNSGRVGGVLAYIEGGVAGVADKVMLEGDEGEFSIPTCFDMLIMNPPFTRATGRTREFEERAAGGRGLFGFIVQEKERENILKAYRRMRDHIRNELREVARGAAKSLPKPIGDIVREEPEELEQYLNIGQAGEGLLFLYLAYRYVRDGGVIAFVLPRSLLAGPSWFLARTLLASKFHVKYVVVSSDPERGYNFSEGTSLSETLIVAKRVERHDEGEETVFINLLRKPSTALEGMMLAEEVMRSAMNGSGLVRAGEGVALVYKVGRRELLDNVDNWNRLVAAPDMELLGAVLRFIEEGELPYIGIRIPLTWLNELMASMGIDRHQFHDHFEVAGSRGPYPVLHGGEEKFRMKMLVRHNAYARARTSRARQIFADFSGRILVPDRIWWDTAHVIALYSMDPLLSNIFYAIRLKVPEDLRELVEKALVLWLNTTWGLLTVLVSRGETRGRWTQLKMAQWRLLRVLDVSSLSPEALRRLAETFDKYAERAPRRIPEQFNPSNPDQIRLGIDRDFIKAIDPSADDIILEGRLRELYRHMDAAFRLWIGGAEADGDEMD
jgi:hypothetical protein